MNRMHEKYKNELAKQLREEFKLSNIMEVSKLKKISVRKHGTGNIGLLTIKELAKNIKNDRD